MSWSSGSLTSSLQCHLAKELAPPSLGPACPIRSILSRPALVLALALALALPRFAALPAVPHDMGNDAVA